jgi:hypothetical protein
MHQYPLQPEFTREVPEWTGFILDKAVADMKSLFFDRNISDFYDSWSENSKKFTTFANFGQMVTAFEQLYGKLDKIEGNNGLREAKNPEYYGTDVKAYVEGDEFLLTVTYNKDRQVGDFLIRRACIYHPPSYVKESRFERITLCDDPRFILSRPTKAGDTYPAAFIVTAACHLDVDGRMGFCFFFRDYEYLSSANIALLRGEYTEEMLDTGDPIPVYAGHAMQHLMARPDINKIFLITQGYGSLFLSKILRKFSGVIAGVVLINPAFEKYPDSPMEDFDINKMPKDVPLFVIQSGFDNVVPEEDQNKWKEIATSLKAKYVFYDKMDHSLVPTDHMFSPQEFGMHEFHISDVALRDIATWIRSQ